ncbi:MULTISPECIES: hypothetical protein [unclassified Leifsonia]|uniref:hypothetical protein n=1 Tax=unclassified Leifsonia TaxID=2663824 RepID=UPI0006F8ECF2|nr:MULTISPECIES: hypothetical protein [unclassified Leifsonia]KQX08049.1 hypothetical protein ASC59_10210 [Leifsonia sp. Root1293]KRA12330.1 hypothetical protein ASD61_10210 [Leifsonia sp. Root60]
MTDPNTSAGADPSRRRIILLIAAGLVVLAVVAIVIALIGNAAGTPGGPGGSSSQKPTGTSTSGEIAPSDQATPTTTPTPPIPIETTVPIESTAQPAPGVAVSVSGFEAVEGEAELAGDVAGPAVRFTVTVSNTTAAAVSLAGALVNVYYGPEQTPADSLPEPGGVPLPAEVAAGGTAEGVLIFTIPEDQRDDVLITFDYQVGTPVTAFQGSVAG